MNILKVLTEKRKLGNLGENEASKFLKKKGYKILHRNFSCELGEIDIIAINKSTVVFAEVKTRSGGRTDAFGMRPSSSVTPEKQRRIIAVSREFKSEKTYGKRQRFDVIEVYTEKTDNGERVTRIEHIENAFDLNSAYPHR